MNAEKRAERLCDDLRKVARGEPVPIGVNGECGRAGFFTEDAQVAMLRGMLTAALTAHANEKTDGLYRYLHHDFGCAAMGGGGDPGPLHEECSCGLREVVEALKEPEGDPQ